MKYGSTKKYLRELHFKFPRVTIPSAAGIHKLTDKASILGHFWARNLLQMLCAYLSETR
jgi:hypothetical protein